MSTTTVGLGPDGIIRCTHGEQAKLATSGTAKNPGRQFYCCPRSPKSAQCKYFCWADDPFLNEQLSRLASAHPQNENRLNTPQLSPPQSTPAKRKFLGQSPLDTAGKKARLEAIQAALSAREQEQADALPFTDGTSETQVSDTPTEPAQDEHRPRYSFLGLSPSQGSEAGAPSTPKKWASSPPLQLYGLHAEPSSSTLLTPPETLKPHANRVQVPGSSASRQEPVTLARHKGKERVNASWDRFTATDEENPFDETAGSLRSRLEQDSFDPSCTPTTGERIASAVSGIRGAINSLRTFGDELGQFDAARYIERLERQKRALEIKDKAKGKRIEDLEIERDVLRERLRRLEEQYAKMR